MWAGASVDLCPDPEQTYLLNAVDWLDWSPDGERLAVGGTFTGARNDESLGDKVPFFQSHAVLARNGAVQFQHQAEYFVQALLCILHLLWIIRVDQ